MRSLCAVAILLSPALAIADDTVAIVWDEPASAKDAMLHVSVAREIADDFVTVRSGYPIELDGVIVLGFCRDTEVAAPAALLRLIRPGITTRADLARPADAATALSPDCPDGAGVAIDTTQVIKRGNRTLTAVALVIEAPTSRFFVREKRVTYHAFLREGARLLDHWAGDNSDWIGTEQPRLSRSGSALEVIEPCRMVLDAERKIGSERPRSRLSISGRTIKATTSAIEQNCTVPDGE